MNGTFESDVFELAPIAMWIEDFSEVKALFDRWRADGVGDISAFFREDLERVAECSRRIRVLRVNRKTLELFEARDLEHLTDNLSRIFRDDMLETHINELSDLWEGKSDFSSSTTNYTLRGRRLDIQLRGSVLPGFEASLGKVLLTTEDVTSREDARRAEFENRRRAEGIFEHSPVSLWVEDFSGIRMLIEEIRDRGHRRLPHLYGRASGIRAPMYERD